MVLLKGNIDNLEMTEIIVSDKDILFGKPRIKGTRISVEQVLEALSEGMSFLEIENEFGVSGEQIRACIAFANR